MMAELTAQKLNELTASQFATLRVLKVSEHQEILGKTFEKSIED